jgi:hypothetical protein
MSSLSVVAIAGTQTDPTRTGGALLAEVEEPTPALQATVDIKMADGQEKSQLRRLPAVLGRVAVG